MRFLAALLALLVVVPVLAVAVFAVGLNTAYGRQLAVSEIDKFFEPQIEIAGLAGHFPEDIKLRTAKISDSQGVYATAQNLELRWQPLALLSRRLAVKSLTASAVSVARPPVAAKSSKSGAGLPPLQLDVTHFAISTLNLGSAIAGQNLTLAVDGHLRLKDLTHGNAALHALAANGGGAYNLTAAIDSQTVTLNAQIDEPADGLIVHLAAPDVHQPLHVQMALSGPTQNAKLDFSANLGAAALNGAGFLGLNPTAPRADIVLKIPALAPAAALAGQNLAGAAQLHLIAAAAQNTATISLDGDVDLTQAPGPAAALVGPAGKFSAVATLARGKITMQALQISGAGFTAAANGVLTRQGSNLYTQAAIKNVAMLSPGITGPVSAKIHLSGTTDDFAINGTVTGNIAKPGIQSGPFTIALDAKHLPEAPQGSLTGSGELENAPLKLNAKFARDAAGTISAEISQSSWRSFTAAGKISLAPGAALPDGNAQFAVANLADFSAFLPYKLSGALNGDFSHPNAQNFSLHLTAKNLVALPQFGAIDANLSATGPETALAVTLQAGTNKILGAPAHITLAGILNVVSRAASLNALTATWRQVDAKLLGPASLATAPGIALRHAALALNGGTITFDGAITPKLNFSFAAQNIPANLVALAAPIKAAGKIDAAATLTGAPQNPTGTITLTARNARILAGIAQSLPPASFTAKLRLADKTANLQATLALAKNLQLAAGGFLPLDSTGPLSLHLTGTTDLRLLDPITSARGTTLRGTLSPDLTITGTQAAPAVNGTLTLANGAVQDISSGLNLTQIAFRLAASGRLLTLQNLNASAGGGTITAHGTLDLGQPPWPLNLVLTAANATPVASDLATESANAALTLKGDARGAMALGGTIDLLRANINIPKSLPPDVANLPILNEGETPPPPPPPPPNIALDLTIAAKNQIFIRGDGLFAELGGKVHLAGTAKNPDPEGGFTLIRGSYALAGKTLQFTQGTVNFTGDGFMPTLDLEASTTTASNATATLIVGGTAAKPTITLTASPPLPSDEVLSELLFGEATASLSPFQAASLAAALASLSGVGGSAISDPLGGVRSALGLDELSLGGTGSGAPTVNAGRYVAPGVYVGAQQSTTGQGTEATVQINLLKGLQLQTSTGTASAGAGTSSSIGLTYQLNY